MKLNEREVFILIEALETWEKEPMSNNLTSSMMGSMLGAITDKGDSKAHEMLEESMAKEKVKAETEQLNRKREVILLKAKIVSINNKE